MFFSVFNQSVIDFPEFDSYLKQQIKKFIDYRFLLRFGKHRQKSGMGNFWKSRIAGIAITGTSDNSQ